MMKLYTGDETFFRSLLVPLAGNAFVAEHSHLYQALICRLFKHGIHYIKSMHCQFCSHYLNTPEAYQNYFTW